MFKPALTYFIPVCLVAGQAVPRPGHGSGDLAVLVEADGFLELPADRDTFKAGELFPFIQFRNTQR
jgi:molybdopterin molybdotransferase